MSINHILSNDEIRKVIDDVHERWHLHLKSLPHVLNTRNGLKEVKGLGTGVPCITVYVDSKVSCSVLKPEECIPSYIEGVPTDVVEWKPVGWVIGKTEKSLLSPEEQKRLLGLGAEGGIVQVEEDSVTTDYEVNWLAMGKCTAVEDQGNCGSCTSFGSGDAMQDDLFVLQNVVVSLSKQQPFFCSGGTCENGNTVENVLNFLMNTGAPLSQDCPYVSGNGQDEPCGFGLAPDWALRGYTLSSWSYANDTVSMKKALQKAPIVTTMDVYASFFNYVSGVYSPLPNDILEGGHCIEVVGCSDLNGYWLSKNSWGTGWGMSGYFEIAYNTCNFDQQMYVLVPNGHPSVPTTYYTITASASKGGSITPSGSVQVPSGASQSFKIKPKFCYKIASVLVNGKNAGTGNSYLFIDVTSNNTIEASFVKRFSL